MSDIYQESLALHEQLKGKVEVVSKIKVTTPEQLSLVYSPGVAQPCRAIAEDQSKVYDLTWKQSSVAIISDGSAILGLGNIGPAAGLPVMEGKAMLFNQFAGINAVPLCIETSSPQEIIDFCCAVAPTFGGINLEDIKAPECVMIEQAVQKRLAIPVFHDDQHGTAIVVLAGLINACKLTKRDLKASRIVISGTGAAGSAIIRMLHEYGATHITCFNQFGNVVAAKRDSYDFVVQEICGYIIDQPEISLTQAMNKADIFVGVSAGNILSEHQVASMNDDAIVFAMANPQPEIEYDLAKQANARIVGTGRSDYPNQINNVLAFPGIFKGALRVRAKGINQAMKLAAAHAIAGLIADEELSDTNIVPSVLDPRVADTVAAAVESSAQATGMCA